MTTKYAASNFKRLIPFIDAVDATPEKHFRFESPGYMPLSIERMEYTFGVDPVYSMMHYYIQFGDLMRDPEMTFAVRRSSGEIIPLSFCQSAPPLYREVYQEGFNRLLLQSLDDFLFQWARNSAARVLTLPRPPTPRKRPGRYYKMALILSTAFILLVSFFPIRF